MQWLFIFRHLKQNVESIFSQMKTISSPHILLESTFDYLALSNGLILSAALLESFVLKRNVVAEKSHFFT